MKRLYKLAICMFILAMTHTVAFADDWGLHFPTGGEPPQGNATVEYLAQFGAYYIGNPSENVIYLTFDAGYENDLTAGILDTLKKHQVPAAFFLVGTYIRDNPELVLRMVEEGHIIANHTMSHPDMTKLTEKAAFAKELEQVEDHYRNVTGQEIPRFYRPPSGVYNEANLKLAQELGYHTIFWSSTYKDWDNKNQPSQEEAFSKLMPRTHPGAIVLLHNTAKINALILDELLTRYKDMGYKLESLNHLIGQS